MMVCRCDLITNEEKDCYEFDMRVHHGDRVSCLAKIVLEMSGYGHFNGITCRGDHDMDFHGYDESETIEEFKRKIPYLTSEDYGWDTAIFSVDVDGVWVSCSLRFSGRGVEMDIVGPKGERSVATVRDKMISFAEKNGWIWGPYPDFSE